MSVDFLKLSTIDPRGALRAVLPLLLLSLPQAQTKAEMQADVWTPTNQTGQGLSDRDKVLGQLDVRNAAYFAGGAALPVRLTIASAEQQGTWVLSFTCETKPNTLKSFTRPDGVSGGGVNQLLKQLGENAEFCAEYDRRKLAAGKVLASIKARKARAVPAPAAAAPGSASGRTALGGKDTERSRSPSPANPPPRTSSPPRGETVLPRGPTLT